MMVKYTKGPWKIGEDGDVFCEHGCCCVATVCGAADDNPTEEAKANAQLIAAAPEVLEALEKYIKTKTPPNSKDIALDEVADAWYGLLVVIAKAKGEKK